MVLHAWRDGWRRVVAAPAIVAGVFVMTFVLALPLALAVRDALRAQLGRSDAARAVADGVDYDWWQEFTAQATGLATTFVPSIIGFAAPLDNISSVLDRRAEIAPLIAALAAYLAGWTFLMGGIVDRFARQRPTRAYGFFAAAGGSFFRLLRLAAIAGLVYWWLFRYVHAWLDSVYLDLIRDVGVERVAIAWRVSFYVVFGALLLIVNVVFDYAKVRLVVEDRRSALGALAAAARFVARNRSRVAGLYALDCLAFAVLLAVWAIVAPGAGGAGASVWLTFLAGQIYVLARLMVKLHFLAAETSLFQASLAHAAYTAAPERVWPDSPAAEAVARLSRH